MATARFPVDEFLRRVHQLSSIDAQVSLSALGEQTDCRTGRTQLFSCFVRSETTENRLRKKKFDHLSRSTQADPFMEQGAKKKSPRRASSCSSFQSNYRSSTISES
jgi:hypothetical protein